MTWWEQFFEGAWDQLHTSLWSHEQTSEQCDAIERLLALHAGAEILDVPAGVGRHSIELARRGYRLCAVERGANLLKIAQEAATQARVQVDFEHRDMRDLPWEARFDAAFCYWGSFGYFDDGQNFAFLHAVARSLKPGGRFLIDTHTTETIFPVFASERFDRIGDLVVLHENSWDHEQGRIEGRWTYIAADGSRTQSDSSIRLYSYRELTDMLSDAGFGSWTPWGDAGGTQEFALGSRRLYMVATK